MKLSAPTQPVFIIAVIIFLLGLLSFLGVVPVIAGVKPFWLVTTAFVALLLGNLLTNV